MSRANIFSVMSCTVNEKEKQRVTGKKWKEELERYSRNKYEDDEMRKKAKEELDEWDERGRRWEERIGGRQGPRLTMSVLMQRRASFPNGNAVGICWHFC